MKQKSLPSKEDFYFLYYFSKSNSWKTSLTGKLFSILSIVLASNEATETTFNLSNFFSSGKIIVSVTTTSLAEQFFNLSTAGPENTGCVHATNTFLAPFSSNPPNPYCFLWS